MADNINPEIIEKLAEAFTNVTREMDPVVQANKQAAQRAKELSDEFDKLKKQVRTSFVDMAVMSTKMSGGSAKYSQSIESLSSASASLATKFIGATTGFNLLAKAVGGVIGIFGQLAANSLKQNDALTKTYNDLSKFGANSSSNFGKMLTNLQKAGFNSENAEGFVNALKKVGPELALFGSGVGYGADKLVTVFNKGLLESERHFARFGLSTEELFNYTASSIAQQSVTGAARLKTEKQLNQEANTYIQNLSELSVLTGLERDQLDKNRRAQENDLRWQWHLRKLDMSDNQADREQAQKQRLLNDLLASQSKDMSEGYKSMMVNNGKVFDEFAVGLQFMTGNDGLRELYEYSSKSGNAVGNLADTLNKISPNIFRTLSNMEVNFSASNENMKGLGDGLGGMKLAVLGEAANREKFEKLIHNIQTAEANDRINENVTRAQNERRLNNTLENITYSVGNLAVPAMTKLTDITNILANTFAKLIKAFTFGMVDYTKEFKTAADVLVDAKDQWKRFKDIGAEIANIEEKRKSFAKGSQQEAEAVAELIRLHKERKDVGGSLIESDQQRQRLGGSSIFGSDQSVKEVNQAINPNAGAKPLTKTEMDTLDDLFIFPDSNKGGKSRIGLLDSGLREKLIAAGKEYKETTGNKLQINSSARTTEEQALEYKTNPLAAPPGTSRHEFGKAVDIQQGLDGNKQAIDILKKHGLFQKYVEKDPVHFEGAYNGAIFRGPKSGYWTKLHGTEGVFNEKQMSTLSNALTRHPFAGGGGVNTASSNVTDYFIAMIEKLTELVDLQVQNNRTGEEHLQYTKSN